MVFNSLSFLIFLPIVIFLYSLVKGNSRIYLLLFASYLFYSYWNPYYLILIILSTGIDYFVALKMESSFHKKKLLMVSIFSNLGILFVFKYYNFFIDNMNFILSPEVSFSYLHVLLPVGISFYTFQSMSYTIDVYQGRLKCERNPFLFALYVSYFPQLVAGPIERATHLLPLMKNLSKLKRENFEWGLPLIIWGLYKKMVVADKLSIYVDNVYSMPDRYNFLTILFANIFFSFQIYCDFSGYTDIARGVSRLFGIELMDNFKLPYFAKNIREFWGRWHISLTSFFKDYLYKPLGGNRKNYILNLLIVFIISGIWHGANWTFIFWALAHFLFYLIFLAFSHFNIQLPSILKVFITFFSVTFAWIFFRSKDLSSAWYIIKKSFDITPIGIKTLTNALTPFSQTSYALAVFITAISTILFLIVAELYPPRSKRAKNIFWAITTQLILFLGVYGKSSFIYFQF
jgi:alginate O-acetyltransferase complex protein AlgI